MQKAAIFQIVIVAAALLAACSGDSAETTVAADGPLVEVVQVTPASVAGAIRTSGMIVYRREPVLAFPAAGVVGAIDVDSGDIVRRGQRLATLRRTGLAGSNVDETALARANAERDLARTQELFDRGFVSVARLDDARLVVERARDSSVLNAPADGIILRRAAEPSQMLAAGAPVLVLGETGSGIVVRAPVASSDAARIRVGDGALVRATGAERVGRVTRVGAKGNQATGAFEVEIEVTAPEGLRSGMVAEVQVAAQPGDASQVSIIVPTLSLLDARADQGIVYVIDENTIARRRAVRTAGVTQTGVIVVEGLNPGDRVVAAGAAYVRDGESVRIAAGT